MYNQIVWLYRLFDAEKRIFEEAGLNSNFHIDFYTSGILEEFNYDLPAIFINYEIKRDDLGRFRILLRLYIVIERMGDSSNISGIENEELQRRLGYNKIIREILEGRSFPGANSILFKREVSGYFIGRTIEVPMWDVDFFTQEYEFESGELWNNTQSGVGSWIIGLDNIVN
jgi:hypothetical protein